MPLIDMTQTRRKLKKPQIRKWTHNKQGWGYYSAPGTKAKLALQSAQKSTRTVHHTVAYKGKEYAPKEFLKKHPKYKLKGKQGRIKSGRETYYVYKKKGKYGAYKRKKK